MVMAALCSLNNSEVHSPCRSACQQAQKGFAAAASPNSMNDTDDPQAIRQMGCAGDLRRCSIDSPVHQLCAREVPWGVGEAGQHAAEVTWQLLPAARHQAGRPHAGPALPAHHPAGPAAPSQGWQHLPRCSSPSISPVRALSARRRAAFEDPELYPAPLKDRLSE